MAWRFTWQLVLLLLVIWGSRAVFNIFFLFAFKLIFSQAAAHFVTVLFCVFITLYIIYLITITFLSNNYVVNYLMESTK